MSSDTLTGRALPDGGTVGEWVLVRDMWERRGWDGPDGQCAIADSDSAHVYLARRQEEPIILTAGSTEDNKRAADSYICEHPSGADAEA